MRRGEFFVRRLQRDEVARRPVSALSVDRCGCQGRVSASRQTADLGQRLERAIDRDVTAGWLAVPTGARLATGAGIAASVVLVGRVWGSGFIQWGPDSPMPGAGSADFVSSQSPDLPSTVDSQQLASVSDRGHRHPVC